MSDNNIIQNLVEDLQKSPMFNLSLSSKELFHSNFIAWMFETYPQYTCDFLKHFDLCIDPECKGILEPNISKIEIQRESEHTDIKITGQTVGGNTKCSYMIENKVKSIATVKQLADYSRKLWSIREFFYLYPRLIS